MDLQIAGDMQFCCLTCCVSPGSASDLTACQLRNPSSSLPQVVSVASAQSSKKPAEDALQKRELRLMKNR